MGTNCHISVKTEEGESNIALMNAADIRFTQSDRHIRTLLGIPECNEDGFWEHLEQDDYQRVLDAALVHREVLDKKRDQYHDFHPDVIFDSVEEYETVQHDFDRVNEWISYYEIAATLVKLGHHVTCYGC
jgi:hypothetical protein